MDLDGHEQISLISLSDHRESRPEPINTCDQSKAETAFHDGGENSLLTLYGSERQGAQRTAGSPVVLQRGSWDQGRSGAEMEKELFFWVMSSSH